MKKTTNEQSFTMPFPNQFAELLTNLCDAKRAIDTFFETQTDGPMRFDPSHYHNADGKIGDAICSLSEYIGWFMVDSLMPKRAPLEPSNP